MTDDERAELEALRAEVAALKAADKPRLNGFDSAINSARREAMWAVTGADDNGPVSPVATDVATVVLGDMGIF